MGGYFHGLTCDDDNDDDNDDYDDDDTSSLYPHRSSLHPIGYNSILPFKWCLGINDNDNNINNNYIDDDDNDDDNDDLRCPDTRAEWFH